MNEKDNFIYCRLIPSANNINQAKPYFFALNSEITGNSLYIERQFSLEYLSSTEYEYLKTKTYFKGLTEADAEIGCIYNDGEKQERPVNIFTNNDDAIIKKIRNFLITNSNPCKETIRFIIFKNSFEEVLFEEFVGRDFLENNNFRLINLNSSFITSEKKYNQVLEGFIEQSLKEIEEDEENDNKEESIEIFNSFKLVIETMILATFFKYVLNN